jgi:hypothetical protein
MTHRLREICLQTTHLLEGDPGLRGECRFHLTTISATNFKLTRPLFLCSSVGTRGSSTRTIESSGASSLIHMSSMNHRGGTQTANSPGISDLIRRLGTNVKVKEKQNFSEACVRKLIEYLRSPEWQASQDNPSGFPDEGFELAEAVTGARLALYSTALAESDPADAFTTIKQIKDICLCSQRRIPVVRAFVEGEHRHHVCFCGKHQVSVQQELRETNWNIVLANICATFEEHCTTILTNAVAEFAEASPIADSSMNADQYSVTGFHR